MRNNDNAQPRTAGAGVCETQLFVYGTLRHDQPEHARYCRGVTSWDRARVRGRLWQLPSGYALLVVPREDVRLRATSDLVADERHRAALLTQPHAGLADTPVSDADRAGWIAGEVLHFSHAGQAWPPIDRWEDFTPGSRGAYQRCVISAWVGDGAPAELRLAFVWAYVAVEPPPGAFPLGPV